LKGGTTTIALSDIPVDPSGTDTFFASYDGDARFGVSTSSPSTLNCGE
jgi:hypothetical protein